VEEMVNSKQTDNLGLAVVPEVATPTNECPNPSQWQCFDDMATEVEVLELLYSLVRAMRPAVIVETGTYKGIGTYYLATAARDNGFGEVHTAEPFAHLAREARSRLAAKGLTNVTVHQKTGVDMIFRMSKTVDFAFLDSNMETRVPELVTLYPMLKDGAIVAVHDTNTFHATYGGPRKGITDLANELTMQLIQLDTPRGLTLLRK